MTSSPLLHVEAVRKQFGQRVTAAGVNIEIENGEFFTMLGPSGSGKSTVLRMIAGLEQPDSGRILIGGQDVTDLPPWRRELGMVFQQYANFPHMNVAQNVAYGLRRKKLDRETVRQRVAELLKLVNLTGFESRPVTQLSGGEQQRVAIARALAPRPRLLLLDEPLSALDEKIRREMQVQLKEIQRATNTAFIYVTHDQEEALTMSDRVAVLNWGHLIQVDEPHVLFRRPKTKFAATFFRGSNVVEGKLSSDGRSFECPSFSISFPEPNALPGKPPAVAIRAENIELNGPSGANDIRFDAVLEKTVYRGIYTDYVLKLVDGQSIVASLTSGPDLAVGQSVAVSVKRECIVMLHADPL
jgi:ABC-type Fe3+/spermidine/putrescine transport system ATPase subunit